LTFICIGLCAVLIWVLQHQSITISILAFSNIAATLIYALAVIGSRDFSLSGYYWLRWLDPAILLFSAACICGVAIILSGSLKMMGSPKMQFCINLVLGLTAVSLAAPGFISSFAHTRERLTSDSRAINILNVQAGKWVYKNTPVDSVVGVIDAGAIRYFGQRKTIDMIGLNNSDVAYKQIKFIDLLNTIDWLVVFPDCQNELGPIIKAGFTHAQTFRIARDEYTICDNPCQTVKCIYKKKAVVFKNTPTKPSP
ncbi:MAG: hypothetical protein GY868_09275, partial [Deltaproteobacteria bacterium]|nr:hypothetical protein [Deltaproteobacteria bacterium]